MNKYVLPTETLKDRVLNKLNYFVNLIEISQVYVEEKNREKKRGVLLLLKNLIQSTNKEYKELVKLCEGKNQQIEIEIKKLDSMIDHFKKFTVDDKTKHIRAVLKNSNEYNKIIKDIIKLCC